MIKMRQTARDDDIGEEQCARARVVTDQLLSRFVRLDFSSTTTTYSACENEDFLLTLYYILHDTFKDKYIIHIYLL